LETSAGLSAVNVYLGNERKLIDSVNIYPASAFYPTAQKG
jgi:hypothetical protein